MNDKVKEKIFDFAYNEALNDATLSQRFVSAIVEMRANVYKNA